MFVSVLVLLAAPGCLRATVGDRHKSAAAATAVPIEKVYPYFSGGPSGIMVRRENSQPVIGYAVEPFRRPDTNRNHYRRRKNGDRIVILVLHYTADYDFETAVKHFTTNTTVQTTSAHYVIAKPTEAVDDKQLMRVVPENCISFNAGISKWDKYVNINPISIGIEIVNTGSTRDPFYPEQVHTAGLMLARMVQQYNILPRLVVGHEDVAPNRKHDPGVLFPWAKLYKDYGVGAWLDDDEMFEKVIMVKYKPKKRCPRAPNKQLFLNYLHAYGYDTKYDNKSILAFKAHFTANQKPEELNEVVTSADMYWIWALVAKYADGRI